MKTPVNISFQNNQTHKTKMCTFMTQLFFCEQGLNIYYLMRSFPDNNNIKHRCQLTCCTYGHPYVWCGKGTGNSSLTLWKRILRENG